MVRALSGERLSCSSPGYVSGSASSGHGGGGSAASGYGNGGGELGELGSEVGELVERAVQEAGREQASSLASMAARLKLEQQARLQTEEQAATMLAAEEASIGILEARVRDLTAKLSSVRVDRVSLVSASHSAGVRTPSPSRALAGLERRHDLPMRAMGALGASPLVTRALTRSADDDGSRPNGGGI
ncbi:hypothetical protein T492DRAFT_1023424 [Pavlovales sp. CCMP2436]|nr:hypothetical protein T492DRAFT_1023424 [Pavlovales sp. CCMP2436]|mmetsp:Transcript_26430/g.61682  ORF Transcript_26430/g.61682 Transcript_26430/m.61682 type:complete len:187 (+) Transcript_26430:3-563(+)